MRVTDEMVERAVTAHEKTYGPYAASETGREVLRLLLEAALAVVPEPYELERDKFVAMAMSARNVAEAKLAEVREWLWAWRREDPSPVDAEAYGQLKAILDRDGEGMVGAEAGGLGQPRRHRGRAMKVTKQMEHRFIERMCATRAFGTLADSEVRACLEAALADVPEPQDALVTRSDIIDAWERWKLRAKAAEAKLAKVRAWAEENAGDIFAGQYADLVAILEEP